MLTGMRVFTGAWKVPAPKDLCHTAGKTGFTRALKGIQSRFSIRHKTKWPDHLKTELHKRIHFLYNRGWQMEYKGHTTFAGND